MKLEQISLRTGFLLALAGWAAAVWLATGFGLGSQLPGTDGDADTAPSLPALPPLAAERMASADSYSAIGERPLFAEDRKPRPYLLGGSEPAASAALRLTGVLLTGDFGMATFTTEQNRSLRLRLNGDAVDGWQLVGLAPRQATVIGPGGSQVLELAVFNGQGGEPPTVLRGANGAPPAGAIVVPPPAGAPPAPSTSAAAPQPQQQPAGAVPPPAAAPPANTNGPSEAQMQAIRERIQARRRQLQQQQQQQPSPPPGDGTNR
ncbi:MULTISPECIES: general secretion pathway protein GspN [Stenotrophomonas]|uniref:General secretion pathway protein GspN n=1 Tax=Stenotrophomonas maltophilia TaxID=40324 RepID=A0AAI9C2S3_STEMA|nr:MULTISPECIES: general secretion pathway protein GspN [Stenotrophomonas]AWT13301.1 general secretion pathway protein GspN [Stenotrophomonas maltophilia]EKT4092930.1 general secretion pathway protein GspN [Stenotrophomonas maltophilia]ELF4101464.1 general secretion pathway protein GspN [Stenotrophomonas maltophilia]MBA0360874.1 general secretion pathway protein GspN [Stenotrophomonas maltophilia]MBA0432392.1 general secretion pathway protein GspN [Stenotrophomonas maltophilia]